MLAHRPDADDASAQIDLIGVPWMIISQEPSAVPNGGYSREDLQCSAPIDVRPQALSSSGQVLVAGEAGVGKSALAERLERDLPDARWCWGVRWPVHPPPGGSDARRGLRQSRQETADVSRDRDNLLDQRETARAYTASAVAETPESPNGLDVPDAPAETTAT
jgi:hypothetical protein